MIFPAIIGCLLVDWTLSADILAVFPHTGKSHFDVFEPLVLALAARGHSLTVISFYPQKSAVTNYKDISLVGIAPLRVSQVEIPSVENSILDSMSMNEMATSTCEKVLQFKPVQQLLEDHIKFDLIILEIFNSDCFLSLVNR